MKYAFYYTGVVVALGILLAAGPSKEVKKELLAQAHLLDASGT